MLLAEVSRSSSAGKRHLTLKICAGVSVCILGNYTRPRDHVKRVLMKEAYSHEWGKNMRSQKKLPLHRVQGQVQQVLIKGTKDTGGRFLEEEEYRKDGGSQSMFPKQQHPDHQRTLLEIQSQAPPRPIDPKLWGWVSGIHSFTSPPGHSGPC